VQCVTQAPRAESVNSFLSTGNISSTVTRNRTQTPTQTNTTSTGNVNNG